MHHQGIHFEFITFFTYDVQSHSRKWSKLGSSEKGGVPTHATVGGCTLIVLCGSSREELHSRGLTPKPYFESSSLGEEMKALPDEQPKACYR